MKLLHPTWLHLTLNALGLPGAGTVMAGRRRLGYFQMLLSLVLMAGTLVGLVRLIHVLWTSSANAPDNEVFTQWPRLLLELPEALHALRLSVICALLYLANLIWSLASCRPCGSSPPPLPPSGG